MTDHLREEVYTFTVNRVAISIRVPLTPALATRRDTDPDDHRARAAEIKSRLRDACRTRFGPGHLLRHPTGYVWRPKAGRPAPVRRQNTVFRPVSKHAHRDACLTA